MDTYDGIVFDGHETYFSIRVAAFAPDSSGFTELEQAWITGFKWWTVDELDSTKDIVHPAVLADLVRTIQSDSAPVVPLTLHWR